MHYGKQCGSVVHVDVIVADQVHPFMEPTLPPSAGQFALLRCRNGPGVFAKQNGEFKVLLTLKFLVSSCDNLRAVEEDLHIIRQVDIMLWLISARVTKRDC